MAPQWNFLGKIWEIGYTLGIRTLRRKFGFRIFKYAQVN